MTQLKIGGHEGRPMGCQWVHTVKCSTDSTVERHKTRLVAQDFTQTYGIDYHETFSPVAKNNSIKVLVSFS